MVDPSEAVPGSASQRDQVDAPAEALLRLTQSANDFLRFKTIYADGAEAKKTLHLKDDEIRKKSERIKELDSAITIMTQSGQREVLRMKLEKAEIEKEKNDLHAELRHVLEEKKDMAAQLSVTRTEIKEYATYTADLIDLDLTKFSKEMADIWNRTQGLVKKHFSNDISSDLFEEHDKWTQRACSFLHPPSGSILIPSTNSSAAKLARTAVMMNVFSLVFAHSIFTAMPSPLAQAGMDNILSELTEQDERKEALCRAIILSTRNGNPSQDTHLQQIVKWILETFGTLLLPKRRAEFKADVKNLLTVITNCWQQSRRSWQKILATLDFASYPESFKDYPVPYHKHQQSTNGEASDPEDQDEITFVAFPAIIAITRGKPETIYPGFLIRYSHMYEAETEWRAEQKKRRWSRSGVPNSIPGLLSWPGATGAMV